MTVVPIEFKDACLFVAAHHAHHKPPRGWKFGCAAADGGNVVAVVMVGRPTAKALQDGSTLEVTRLCTDRTRHAASMLYAAAWRAARALGYRRLITYTLETECGASLVAAGWTRLYLTRGGSWDRPSRRRDDEAPTCRKWIWEKRQ